MFYIDNERKYTIDDFSNVKSLYKLIVNKNIADLKSDKLLLFPSNQYSDDLTDDNQCIIKFNGLNVSTTNIIGFIGYKNEEITIKSRFYDGDKDFFIQYMLEKVIGNPNLISLFTKGNFNENIINVAIYLFPFYLKKAFKKGYFKKYQSFENNDSSIKGNIDFSKHIKYNTPFLGKVFYKYREFTAINEVNHLIRHTIEYIKRKKIKGIFDGCIDEINKIELVTQDFNSRDITKILYKCSKKNLITNPLYSEYNYLIRLCILILSNSKLNYGNGENKIYGLLFDVSWLWEEYLNTLLSPFFHHPQNRMNNRKGGHYLFSKGDSFEGLIYPDFIKKDSKHPLIVDAKYKFQDSIGKNNRDYFQMLSYMYRFETKIGIFIYPNNASINKEYLYLYKGNSYERNLEVKKDSYVMKLGLNIPTNCDDYIDFTNQMKNNENIFIDEISSY